MKQRTISGVKNYETKERYIRKLKYKYLLLNVIKDPKEQEQIKREIEVMNPYAATRSKEELIQSILSITESKAFKRLLNKTMAHYSNSINSDKTIKRMMHSVSAAGLMLEYCSKLKLNKELGMAIALGHDVGHTAFGHDGEKLFQDLASKYDLGTYSHNLQGRLLLNYIEDIYVFPDVLDGIQCHNGEKEEFEVPVNYEKTPQDSLNDLIKGLAYKGEERKQIPGTFEGAAFRIIDKISYVGQDLADGFREKILNPRKLDLELKTILNDIGLNDKKINELLSQDKDYSLDVVKRTFEKVENLIENFPVSSMNLEKTEKKLNECCEQLEILRTIDFNNVTEFNTVTSQIATKLHTISKSVNLGKATQMMLYSCATDLDSLMSQDTSGGKLAREIEKIFMDDFIENSKGMDHPCMSEKMGDLMYDLIGYTQETVLPKAKKTVEDNKLLEKTVNKLVNHYTNILLASGVVDEIISEIEPNYEQEEKNTHKESGVFDDIETLKVDSKIVGHTRKLFAQNKEYFNIVFKVIKEVEKSPKRLKNLTFREKMAKRIAIDYASRNDEKKLIKKAREKKLITPEEEKKLNTLQKTEGNNNKYEIKSSMFLYTTRVGMHNDRMQRKCEKLEELQDFIKEIKDNNIIELKRYISEILGKLHTTWESYEAVEDFKEKKVHFKAFKRIYGEASDYINNFRKTLNKEELKKLDKKTTEGAPDVQKWKEEAKKQAEETLEK
ncbi:MAG: HD domain-containing protein [Clostridia bacterium]|nr:HD domain-containing protein [Clostridia bacterium]